ncbi:unnamed protein product [Moneuplotes crassus]|uniref:Uncharacterized protein n=1 Tax=Euplotes crassus TaxID=5936 RepID=A0AAD1XWF4_EUPCR|nr:unnamed protein product [Moneuplotes crassus]
MLKKPSTEWNDYCRKLSAIKKKSNREVLCTDCWMILNYEQRGKHNSKFPEHKPSILTSSQFASEIQFYHIAFANNKVVEKSKGVKLVIQPCLFDPKKGSGHMQMIEELCKEMHSSPSYESASENLCESGHQNDIANKDSAESATKCEVINSQLDQETARVSSIDCHLNQMISDLCLFESAAYSQIFWSFNQCVPNYSPMYHQTQVSSTLNKARKNSDADSLCNSVSAATSDHQSPTDASGRSSPALKSKRTAFTIVKPRCKENAHEAFQRPAALPSLNCVSGTLNNF